MGSMFTLSCFQLSYISAQKCQLNVDLGVGGGLLMASVLFISAEGNNRRLSEYIPESHCLVLQFRVPDHESLLHLEKHLALQKALSEQFTMANKESTLSPDIVDITQVNQSSEADGRQAFLQDTSFAGSANCLNARHLQTEVSKWKLQKH